MSETGGNNLIDMEKDNSQFEDPELVLQRIIEDPNLSQYVTRTKDGGFETVVGYYRIGFKPGQQRQVLHVPFVPALRLVPNVEANSTDDQSVRVRITDRQRFGIRAEVVNSIPSETQKHVLVEVIATEQ